MGRWYHDAENRRGDVGTSAQRKPSERLIGWRATFAVKLYAVLDSPDFLALERSMSQVGISTLRVLQQRFWHGQSTALHPAVGAGR